MVLDLDDLETIEAAADKATALDGEIYLSLADFLKLTEAARAGVEAEDEDEDGEDLVDDPEPSEEVKAAIRVADLAARVERDRWDCDQSGHQGGNRLHLRRGRYELDRALRDYAKAKKVSQ